VCGPNWDRKVVSGESKFGTVNEAAMQVAVENACTELKSGYCPQFDVEHGKVAAWGEGKLHEEVVVDCDLGYKAEGQEYSYKRTCREERSDNGFWNGEYDNKNLKCIKRIGYCPHFGITYDGETAVKWENSQSVGKTVYDEDKKRICRLGYRTDAHTVKCVSKSADEGKYE
jgi:hypothetical protein